MSIKFYSMERCSYCQNTRDLFARELQNGEMVELPASMAANIVPKVLGYPYFAYNGKSHTGFPGNKQTLYDKLGYTPPYGNVPSGNVPRNPPLQSYRDVTACVPATWSVKLSDLPAVNTYVAAVFLCNPGNSATSIPSSASVYILRLPPPPAPPTPTPPQSYYRALSSSNTVPVVASSDVSGDPSYITVDKIVGITTPDVLWNLFVKNYTKVFPCLTTQTTAVTTNRLSAMVAGTVTIDEFVPQPCKSDSSLYCCNGTDSPAFFDTKTIIMLSVLVFLFLVIAFLLMGNNKSSDKSKNSSMFSIDSGSSSDSSY